MRRVRADALALDAVRRIIAADSQCSQLIIIMNKLFMGSDAKLV